MALARVVLPQPGGPYNSIERGSFTDDDDDDDDDDTINGDTTKSMMMMMMIVIKYQQPKRTAYDTLKVI